MSSSYKEDEKAIKDIVKRGVESLTPEQGLKLIGYYKTRKTSELVVRNNPSIKTTDLKKSSVVYEYSCPLRNCKLQSKYIGMTETTLNRRLTCHLSSGAHKLHTKQVHNEKLTRAVLESHTVILAHVEDRKRLQFLEAIFIINEKPTMNVQVASFDVLPSLCVVGRKSEGGGPVEGAGRHRLAFWLVDSPCHVISSCLAYIARPLRSTFVLLFGLSMIHVGSKRCENMNFSEVIFILPPQTRSVVRRMESVWRKIINAEAAVSFNNIYI